MRLPKSYHWSRAYHDIVKAITCVLFGVHDWYDFTKWYSDEELAEQPWLMHLECLRCHATKLGSGPNKGRVYLGNPDPTSITPRKEDL